MSAVADHKIEKDLEQSWDLWRLVPIDQVQAAYCQNLLRSQKFIDHFFPPTVHSIQGDSTASFGADPITWKRPETFMRDNWQLFSHGISPTDIKQGVLGDCWFLGALAALAENESFIRKLFPEGELLKQWGMYRIRLWANGESHMVVVDDYIPCRGSGPVFSKCNGNELWVALIEKAYAKLHGSYASLLGGFPQDSFIDLSGCPTWSYQFSEEKVAEEIRSGQFWSQLLDWSRHGYCLATSSRSDTKMERVGLVTGHAYTIMRVVQDGQLHLVQLRNPWGRFEWSGAWSDNSELWTPDLIARIKPSIGSDDGLFWMAFDDLVTNFTSVEVCKVAQYVDRRFKIHIEREEEFGGKPSHYLYLNIDQPTHIIFGIHQEDERGVGVEEYRRYLDLGLVLFRINETEKHIHAYSELRDDREVFLEQTLEPGKYLLFVLTTGAGLRRPSTANPSSFPLSTPSAGLHPCFQSILKDVFRRFDRDCSQELDYEEFALFASIIGHPMTHEQFDEKVRSRFTSFEHGLTLQGFMEIFQEELRKKREKQIRGWLLRLGYDQDCYSIKSRAIVCSVQSDRPISVTQHKISDVQSTTLLFDTWKELCIRFAVSKDLSKNLTLFSLTHKSAGAQTYIFWNHLSENWTLTMDLSSSLSVEYVLRNEQIISKDVSPNTWVIVQHLKRVKTADSARFGYQASCHRT